MPPAIDRKNRTLLWWGVPLAVYLVLVAAVQDTGISVVVKGLIVTCIVTIVVSAVGWIRENPCYGIGAVLLLLVGMLSYVTGGHRYGWAFVRDGVVFLLCLIAVPRLCSSVRAWRRPSVGPFKLRGQLTVVAIAFLLAWVVSSMVARVFQVQLSAEPDRFTQLGPSRSIVPEHATRWEHRRIGLGLSGGGYRAALFHAGTLHALETLGIRVNVLSTVSGGSIIGAYYAIGGDPLEFKKAVIDGRFNLKRELLMPENALRLPFPMTIPYFDFKLAPYYSFNRSDVQANLLRDALFEGRESWRHPSEHQPRLIIGTTELNYGMQIGFIPDGIITLSFQQDRRVYRGEHYVPEQELDLAQRVAISGAFPGAFPGKELRSKVVPCTATGKGSRSLLLADGGITDNRGIDLLLTARFLAGPTSECTIRFDANDALGADWHVDAVILSDASAIFEVEDDQSGMAQLARAADVMGVKSGLRIIDNTIERPVIVSAANAYLPPHLRFLLDDDKPYEREARRSWHLRFDPRDKYPPQVLRAIVALLPEEARVTVERDLESFLKTTEGQSELDRHQRSEWGKMLTRIRSTNQCRERLGSATTAEAMKALPGICEAVSLRLALQVEMLNSLLAFQRTSTLNDWPPAKDAEMIFRLGQLLLYQRWPDVDRLLSARADGAPGATSNREYFDGPAAEAVVR